MESVKYRGCSLEVILLIFDGILYLWIIIKQFYEFVKALNNNISKIFLEFE